VAFFVSLLFKDFSIIAFSLSLYLFLKKSLSGLQSLSVTVFFLFCLLLLINSWAFYDNSWKQWNVRLFSPGQRIRQEITIPKDLAVHAQEALLKIDMSQSQETFGVLTILINGRVIKVYDGKLRVEDKPFPDYFEYQYQVKDPARMRRWFSVSVPVDILQKSNVLNIELLYSDNLSKKGYIDVFGDYLLENNGNWFEGPLFARNLFETSIQKYLQEGDYRLRGSLRLRSLSTISSFYSQDKWDSQDLSNNPGVQKGQYRIRIEIIDKQGESFIL